MAIFAGVHSWMGIKCLILYKPCVLDGETILFLVVHIHISECYYLVTGKIYFRTSVLVSSIYFNLDKMITFKNYWHIWLFFFFTQPNFLRQYFMLICLSLQFQCFIILHGMVWCFDHKTVLAVELITLNWFTKSTEENIAIVFEMWYYVPIWSR